MQSRQRSTAVSRQGKPGTAIPNAILARAGLGNHGEDSAVAVLAAQAGGAVEDAAAKRKAGSGVGTVAVSSEGPKHGFRPDAAFLSWRAELEDYSTPQDMTAAAYLLCDVIPSFPARTIHVAMVDPGVGSTRRGVAIHTGEARHNQSWWGRTTASSAASWTARRCTSWWRRSTGGRWSARFSWPRRVRAGGGASGNGVTPEAFGPRVRDPVGDCRCPW